jgi:DNA-binding LytR/AlgR family response regulator
MTPDGLRLLAVDDEQSQLQDLARLLRSSPLVHEVECAEDGHDALIRASAQEFDAIFLDVRMPDLDGVELARVLRRFAAPPRLVFVSAYDNAAIDAFELQAVDYLLKPVSRRRIEETLQRVATAVDGGERTAEPTPPRSQGADSIDTEVIAVANVRTGATRLVRRSEILYLQSHGDFVRVVTDDGRYLVRGTLAEIERRWEPFGFARVHRQYVCNLRRAVELRPRLGGTAELLLTDGQTIPIARRHAADLGRRLGVKG